MNGMEDLYYKCHRYSIVSLEISRSFLDLLFLNYINDRNDLNVNRTWSQWSKILPWFSILPELRMRKWRKPFTQGVAWRAFFIGHDGADANSQHILNLSGGSMVWTHRHPGALACGLLLFFANQMITRSYSILNIHICHLYFFYKYTYIIYIYITDFDCILIYIVYVSLQPCAAAESRESTTIMWVLGGVYDCMIGLKHHEFDIIE